MSERTRWLLLLVLPPLLWAGNALVGRATSTEVAPIELSFWRWLLALALLLPFTIRDVLAHAPVLRARWRVVVIMGLFSVAAYNTLLYMAVQTTTAINATLMGASMPLMLLLLGRLWLGEPIRPAQALGIAVSALGMLAVVARGDPARLLGLGFTPGDILMLLATLSWAIYSVMLKRYALPVPGAALLAVLIMVGVITLAPLYAWHVAHHGVMSPTPRVLGAIGYTALFASLCAYYFWNRGVAVVGAATAGQFTYLIPLFTAVLAVLLLGEEFRWFHALGGGLIFAGIGLATKRQ
ncbi:MAG: DMT family transporter [Rhodospirillaceae bacterium]|nr:DMT family transporter [Rhodospirillales bacterium]